MTGVRARASDAAWLVAAALGATVLALTVLAPLAGLHVRGVETGSMAPTVPAGSLVLVRDVPVAQVAVGDVVAVTSDSGHRVMHRVVETGPDGLRLRGDANEATDPAPYDVAGAERLLLHVPLLGWLGTAVPAWAWACGLLGLGVLVGAPQERTRREEVGVG